jgi:hypothetical protein
MGARRTVGPVKRLGDTADDDRHLACLLFLSGSALPASTRTLLMAGGRPVFEIDHHEVTALAIGQRLRLSTDRSPPGRAHHVSDEQQSRQRACSTDLVSRMTVTVISPGWASSDSTFSASSTPAKSTSSSRLREALHPSGVGGFS